MPLKSAIVQATASAAVKALVLRRGGIYSDAHNSPLRSFKDFRESAAGRPAAAR
jgi:hypothetical protein